MFQSRSIFSRSKSGIEVKNFRLRTPLISVAQTADPPKIPVFELETRRSNPPSLSALRLVLSSIVSYGMDV